MKRFTLIFFAILTVLSISAQKHGKKAIVVYFSATGNTEAVAKKVAAAAKADIFEILPATPYTAADLDWHNKQSRSSVEMQNAKARPTMRGMKDLKPYSVVYLGYPVWWGVCPRIVNTFIESHNLKGKTIIPFITSGSSSINQSVKELRKSYPKLKFRDGMRLNNATQADILKFVK